MKLVKLNNYQLVVEDELLLLTPFKKLYKKDKSRDKSGFIDFMTIVYFTYDPRSDYSYIVDEEQRLKEVCETNGYELRKFTPEESMCIALYKKLTTTLSQKLLRSTRIAVDKVSEFLENVDLYATDEKGKPLYTLNTITAAIKQVPQLAKDLQEAEKAVAKEIEEASRARGGNEGLTLFDNGYEGI